MVSVVIYIVIWLVIFLKPRPPKHYLHLFLKLRYNEQKRKALGIFNCFRHLEKLPSPEAKESVLYLFYSWA